MRYPALDFPHFTRPIHAFARHSFYARSSSFLSLRAQKWCCWWWPEDIERALGQMQSSHFYVPSKPLHLTSKQFLWPVFVSFSRNRTKPNRKKNGQWKNRVFCKSNKLKTKFKPEMQNNMRNSVARTVETLNKTAHFFSLHRFQIMALIVWHVPFCWAQTIQLRIRHNAIVCIGRHCTVHTINCIANCGLCFWLIECYCQCWHVI